MSDADERQPARTPDAEVAGLLGAARVLLQQGGHRDALPLLHAAIQSALGVSPSAAPRLRYRSQSEAREQHALLLSTWRERSSRREARSAVHLLWSRRPYWFASAMTGVIILLLTLRYLRAIHHSDWTRQHPEGSWISRFYPTPDFEGYPLVRYDIAVNYNFGLNGAADSMPKDAFSASWDTCVRVDQDVSVSLRLDSDDSSKLSVDGVAQLAVDPGPGSASGQVYLSRGLHHLSVGIVERAGSAMVHLQGLEADDGQPYRLLRPIMNGTDVRCDSSARVGVVEP